MNIVLDVDGVIADYVGSLCYRHLQDRRPNDFRSFDLETYLSTHEKQLWEEARLQPGFCGGIAWHNGARIFLHDLREKHEVIFLTARDTKCPHWVAERDEWLAVAGVDVHDIVYCSSKYKHRFHADILVEDNVETLNRWANWHEEKTGILITRPWNAGFSTAANVIRVDSYDDAMKQIDILDISPF